MKRWVLILGLVACNGGSDSDETDTDSEVVSVCEEGCVDTVAAACANSPADEASCTATCEALRVGQCGTEYEAVLACSEGGTVTCDAGGFPTVEACSAEFAAFTACLN